MEDNMNNDNNLYNILNNFNKLSESDTPQPAAQSKPKTLLESTMEQVLQEKYMGFKKTVGALKKQGGVENPEALAASIGRKKYGKKAFQKAAAAGKKLGEGEGPHDWMDDMRALAHKMHPQDKLKQAHADREAQRKSEHQARIKQDRASLPELEAEYQALQGEYEKLGGSNWQYADREQNLSDQERRARDMEGHLRHLANRIHTAKQDVAEGELETGYMNKQHQDFYNKNPNFKRDDREVKTVGDRLASKVTPMNKPAQVTKKPITKFEEESDWSNLGAEYRSTKPGTKEPTHTGEKEYFKGGVKHTKDYDREVSHTAATGEKRGRGRPKKSQFEGHYTIDRLISEAFGEEDKEQSLNYEQDQLRNAIGDDLFAELQRSVRNGDYDFSDNLDYALYEYYFDDMPYGTRKARTGDPSEWIGDKIAEVFSDEMSEGSIQGGVWSADAPKAGQPNVPAPSGDPEGAASTPRTASPGWGKDDYKPLIPDTVKPGSARVSPAGTTVKPDSRGTMKPSSGDPEGVKEDGPVNQADLKSRADAAFADLDDLRTGRVQPGTITPNDNATFDRMHSDLQAGKGTKIKDMIPVERDQYLQSTNRAWDEKTQRIIPAQPKQAQQKEDIMMTNELAEMMRLAGMSESKDWDKDGKVEKPAAEYKGVKDNAIKKAMGKVDESDEKADNDYDNDGKVETGKEEYLGSKIAAAKKAGKLKEGEKANEEKCMECGMYESKCKCDESLEEALNQMRKIAGLKECGMSPIAGAMGDMQQEQGKMNISTNMSSDGNKSVTITADGDSALELMQMLKLAGMGGHGGEEMHQHEKPEGIMVVAQDGEESHDEEVDETKDTRYQANTTPEEHVYPEQVLTKGGDGEVAGKEKRMHGDRPTWKNGDNPLAETSLKFMKEYEGIKVKK
jgi:hypothetical protein